MRGWVIDRVTFSSTKRSADVTLHNEITGTAQSVRVKVQDISIHDGLDALRTKAVTAIYAQPPADIDR
ncbi:hypothetical protein LCM17_23480 [Cereibacter sphaeroides]|nr:hypothetical protein [Cereibacter sphaeroides]